MFNNKFSRFLLTIIIVVGSCAGFLIMERYAMHRFFPHIVPGSNVFSEIMVPTCIIAIAGQILGDVLNNNEYLNGPILTFVKRVVFVIVCAIAFDYSSKGVAGIQFVDECTVMDVLAHEAAVVSAIVIAPFTAILVIVILYATGIGASEKRWFPFVYPISLVIGYVSSIPVAEYMISIKDQSFPSAVERLLSTIGFLVFLPIILAVIICFMSKRWPFWELDVIDASQQRGLQATGQKSGIQSQPSQTRPSTTRTTQNQPSHSRPSTTRPTQSHSTQTRPSTNNPGQNRPSQSRPSSTRPTQNSPSTNRPSLNPQTQTRPTQSQTSHGRPGQNQVGQKRPGQNAPSQNRSRPDDSRSDTNRL